MTEAVASKNRPKTENECCSRCGRIVFKIYRDKGFVFVEMKCDCGKFVIRKFPDFEKTEEVVAV